MRTLCACGRSHPCSNLKYQGPGFGRGFLNQSDPLATRLHAASLGAFLQVAHLFEAALSAPIDECATCIKGTLETNAVDQSRLWH